MWFVIGLIVGLVIGLIDLFRVCVILVGGAASVEYDTRAYSGMSFCDMCVCHVWWRMVEDSVGSLGSLRCELFTGRSSVVRRVSRHV
jgi:hypothetical protein